MKKNLNTEGEQSLTEKPTRNLEHETHLRALYV